MERQWEIDAFRNGRLYTQDATRTKAQAISTAKAMMTAAFCSDIRLPRATAKISLVEYAERDRRRTIERYDASMNVAVSFEMRKTT